MMEITKGKIKEYVGKYDERYQGTSDELVENEVKAWLENNRFLDRERFIKLGMWKSPRPKRHYEANDERKVKEITMSSFQTENEFQRLESLLGMNGGLKGVSYPVASVILHFAFPDRYSILDFRALWSLGWEQPTDYSFAFWQKYCQEIKRISDGTGQSLRTVDKALWEYSKRNQKA